MDGGGGAGAGAGIFYVFIVSTTTYTKEIRDAPNECSNVSSVIALNLPITPYCLYYIPPVSKLDGRRDSFESPLSIRVSPTLWFRD